MKNTRPDLLIIALLILGAGCGNKMNTANSPDQGFAISDTMMKRLAFDTVKQEKVLGEIMLNGKVTPEEDKYVEIFPLVGGNVASVTVESGDYVQKGEVLAIIHSVEIADIEKQLIEAEGDLEQAKKNQDVQKDLYKSRLSSERDYLASQKEVEKAEANMTRIRELLKIYNANQKSDYIVKAPISGFIIDKKLSRDMVLRSDNTQKIFTIAQIDEVWIVADVYESDIPKVREGMEADVKTLAYPDKVFTGKVDKVYNMLDPQTRTMKVRIRLPNPGLLLKPEMMATVRLVFHENEEFPAIPATSVIFDHNKYYVMVFRDRQHVETREINLYRSNDDRTYVASGLKPGEVIISRNQLFIYDELNN